MLSSLCFTTHHFVIPLRGSPVSTVRMYMSFVHELHLRADISPTCISVIPADIFVFSVAAILALSKQSVRAVSGTSSSLGLVGFSLQVGLRSSFHRVCF